MATQTESAYNPKAWHQNSNCEPAGFRPLRVRKVSLDDSNNDRQPEMAAEIGNT